HRPPGKARAPGSARPGPPPHGQVTPAEPAGRDVERLRRGRYRYRPASPADGPRVQLLASGMAMPWALRAPELLALRLLAARGEVPATMPAEAARKHAIGDVSAASAGETPARRSDPARTLVRTRGPGHGPAPG